MVKPIVEDTLGAEIEPLLPPPKNPGASLRWIVE